MTDTLTRLACTGVAETFHLLPEFEKEGEVLTIDPPGRLIVGVDAAAAAIDFACAGRGLVCTFRNWLDPYLESGKLKPVLRDWWHQCEGPRLYIFKQINAGTPARVSRSDCQRPPHT